MLNILPLEEKKKILTEYRLRLGVIVVFAVAVLVGASMVLLVPSYLLAVAKHNLVAGDLARLEGAQSGVDTEGEVNAKIKEVNKKINVFLAEEKTPVRAVPTETIGKVLALKGPSIRIQSLLYDVSTGRLRVVVTGRADDRDSLARFVEILKKEPAFSKVDLPIGSYVKSTDIDFSIVLEEAGAPIKK